VNSKMLFMLTDKWLFLVDCLS